MTAKTLAVSTMLFLTLGVAVGHSTAAEMTIHSQTAFTAGDQAFPAGAYRIERLVANARFLMIRNIDSGKGAILPILAQVDGRDDFPRAVFSVNGDQYSLSQVYLPGMGGFKLTANSKTQDVERLTAVGK
jgi:hypothetical protein